MTAARPPADPRVCAFLDECARAVAAELLRALARGDAMPEDTPAVAAVERRLERERAEPT